MNHRFEVNENEGSWLDEFWLCDSKTHRQYRHDKVPKKIQKAFVNELKDKLQINELEARMLIEIITSIK